MKLERAILMALKNVDPLLLPQTSLAVDVGCLMPEDPTVSELKASLNELEAKGNIVSVRDEIDDTVKYRLSDLGKARLLASRC